ncbi:beta-N-acetylhexosaminidase [soil metagenome]|jgi:beta-N-acetylhexosaminidase
MMQKILGRPISSKRSRIYLASLMVAVLLLAAGCAGGDSGPLSEGAGNAGNAESGSVWESTVAGNTGSKKEAGNGGNDGPEQAVSLMPISREVEKMNLREAVGQMFIISVDGTAMSPYTERAIQERNVGGVLLFGSNMQSKAQVRSLTDSMQDAAMGSEPAVPLLVAVDQEGGPVSNAPWVSPQPSAAEVGAGGDPPVARRIARTMGRELLQAGVNTDFAPVVDTGGGAAIGSRSYGEDPELVGRMGAAAVEGFREAGIVSAAKHFPNHGPATADSHTGRPVVGHDMETVREYDLPPFREAIQAGVPMVMVAHLVYPAIDPDFPASLSPDALGMLREDLGFGGVIVTDDLSMEAATREGSVSGAAVDAVGAGADAMILSGTATEQDAAYEAVVRAVESGEIPRETVYESAERILDMKRRYGLYDRAG